MADPRYAPPKGFDDIHRILGAAMRAVPRTAWPARPHVGGPLPHVPLSRLVDIGYAIATHARSIATRDEAREIDRLVALAKRALAEGRGRLAKDHPLSRDSLVAASTPGRRDSAPIRVGKLVVRTAKHVLHAPPSARNAVGSSLETAAATLVVALGPEEGRTFLAMLDALIVRLELEGILADKQMTAASPISRVLSRPKARKGKTLGLVFAELANGSFGLLVKLKQRWQWHEGDRATMFATVPDEYMEQVIEDLEPSARLRSTLRKSRG